MTLTEDSMLLVTTYVHEGVVMASDSRLVATLASETQPEAPDSSNATLLSDSQTFIYLATNNTAIGIGAARSVIGHHIQTFIAGHCSGKKVFVAQIASELFQYLRQLRPIPEVVLHVAGYDDKSDKEVWNLEVALNRLSRVNEGRHSGIIYSGIATGDVIEKLLLPAGELDRDGKLVRPFPYYDLGLEGLSLQDAIDLSVFLIHAQSEVERFQCRPKKTGGPIDVILIQPGGATWIRKKELH